MGESVRKILVVCFCFVFLLLFIGVLVNVSKSDNELMNVTSLYLHAQQQYDSNNVSESEFYVLKALEINPEHTDSYNLLFDIFLRKNMPEMAEKALAKAHSLEPNKTRTRVDFGKLFMHKKNYAEAISVFKEIIKDNPDDPYAYNYLGFVYYFTGDYENSEKYLNESLRLVESGAEEGETFACPYEGLGMVYYKQNNFEKSKYYLNSSINFRPGIINEKYKLLYDIHMSEQNYDEANKILGLWLRYDPYNNEALNLLNQTEQT